LDDENLILLELMLVGLILISNVTKSSTAILSVLPPFIDIDLTTVSLP